MVVFLPLVFSNFFTWSGFSFGFFCAGSSSIFCWDFIFWWPTCSSFRHRCKTTVFWKYVTKDDRPTIFNLSNAQEVASTKKAAVGWKLTEDIEELSVIAHSMFAYKRLVGLGLWEKIYFHLGRLFYLVIYPRPFWPGYLHRPGLVWNFA